MPLIFFARVADVSLGTFRTIVVFRGRKFLAAFIGFFEIIIWLIAAGQVLTNLDKWYLALAYAGGFAVGNYVGMWIEGRFAIGNELIRCISFHRDILAEKLRMQGFKAVSFDGDMGEGKPVELLLIVEKRRNIPSLIRLIKELDQSAVYSVSDVKSVYEGPDLLPRRSFLGSAFTLSGKRK
ncbi:MAG: DUF2179 domain-containing protein [SAR324 cluster bacterium]|nr:DUF2179 domain-containing protein [SAR324 cluster bacterium]